jgi:hypothetical protein
LQLAARAPVAWSGKIGRLRSRLGATGATGVHRVHQLATFSDTRWRLVDRYLGLVGTDADRATRCVLRISGGAVINELAI